MQQRSKRRNREKASAGDGTRTRKGIKGTCNTRPGGVAFPCVYRFHHSGASPNPINCHTPLVALFIMNRLPIEKRALILQLISEGMGINATTRIVGCSKNTVLKLLRDAGIAAAIYQHQTFKNLPCRRIQADEIWSFVYAKKDTQTDNPDAGDVWTWIAICEDSKLVPTWWIGDRTYQTGIHFMEDLAARMANPIQLTTDGLSAYIDAVGDAFGDWQVDHRILKRKYPVATTARTSYIERQNLTLRMRNRRYARATNAFSKKLENHAHSMALYFMTYNYVMPHKTLRGRTPAMAIGIANRPWTYEDIIHLTDGDMSHPAHIVQESGQAPSETASNQPPLAFPIPAN